MVPLETNIRIYWKIRESNNDIVGIGFEYSSSVKYFVATNPKQLEDVKKAIGNKAMLKDIRLFYAPLRPIGKGSFA